MPSKKTWCWWVLVGLVVAALFGPATLVHANTGDSKGSIVITQDCYKWPIFGPINLPDGK